MHFKKRMRHDKSFVANDVYTWLTMSHNQDFFSLTAPSTILKHEQRKIERIYLNSKSQMSLIYKKNIKIYLQ